MTKEDSGSTMSDWCGTTDIRSLFLGGLILLLSPFIALYFLGNFLYCKLVGKVFLEKEKQELEEGRRLPPIGG